MTLSHLNLRAKGCILISCQRLSFHLLKNAVCRRIHMLMLTSMMVASKALLRQNRIDKWLPWQKQGCYHISFPCSISAIPALKSNAVRECCASFMKIEEKFLLVANRERNRSWGRRSWGLNGIFMARSFIEKGGHNERGPCRKIQWFPPFFSLGPSLSSLAQCFIRSRA